jgi:hypothetical protein
MLDWIKVLLIFVLFHQNCIRKNRYKIYSTFCVMMATYRSLRVTTLYVFDPAIWLCVMVILILLSHIVLIDSVDNLDFASIFPVILEGKLGFQLWKMCFNFDIILLHSTLILNASFPCSQVLGFFWGLNATWTGELQSGPKFVLKRWKSFSRVL